MRIIAGVARGIILEVAKDSAARPFLEMARGALFNALGGRIDGARALDLYAGSGALGLEALSRGAAECVFVERDRRSVEALRKNVAKCRFDDRARIRASDVSAALRDDAGRYDLIFVDPPFPELSGWRADGPAGGIMRDAARLLSEEGELIFRIEDKRAKPPEWPGLELVKEKRYGRSRICRYRILTNPNFDNPNEDAE